MENIVINHNGQPLTTSLLIAEKFGKEHKNILRDIETLDCSKEFNQLNFEPTYYLDSQNRAQPMYYITRDGFSFLVMGFTGTQAARFKEDFINAFNTISINELLVEIDSRRQDAVASLEGAGRTDEGGVIKDFLTLGY